MLGGFFEMSLKVLSKYLDDLSKREIDLLTECRDIQEVKNLLNHFGYSLDEKQFEEIRLSYAKEIDRENNGNTLSMSQLEQVVGGWRGRLRLQAFKNGSYEFDTIYCKKVQGDNISEMPDRTSKRRIFIEGNSICIAEEKSPDKEELRDDENKDDGKFSAEIASEGSEKYTEIPRNCEYSPSLCRWFMGGYVKTDSDSILCQGSITRYGSTGASEVFYSILSIKALERTYNSLPKDESFYIKTPFEQKLSLQNEYIKISREEAAFFLCMGLNNSLIEQEQQQSMSNGKQEDEHLHKTDAIQVETNSDENNTKKTILKVDDEDKKDYEVNFLTERQYNLFQKRAKFYDKRPSLREWAEEANEAVGNNIYNFSIYSNFLDSEYDSKEIIIGGERWINPNYNKYTKSVSGNIFGSEATAYGPSETDEHFFNNREVKKMESIIREIESMPTEPCRNRAIGQTVGAGIGFGIFAPLGIIALSVEPVKAFVAASIAVPISHAISFLSISAVSIGLPVFSIILGIGFFLGFGIYAYKNFGALRAIRDKSSKISSLLPNNSNFNSSDD